MRSKRGPRPPACHHRRRAVVLSVTLCHVRLDCSLTTRNHPAMHFGSPSVSGQIIQSSTTLLKPSFFFSCIFFPSFLFVCLFFALHQVVKASNNKFYLTFIVPFQNKISFVLM